MVIKNAPERLLQRCETILLNDDKRKIDKNLSESVLDACLRLAVYGTRVMAFCYLLLSTRSYPPSYQLDGDAVNCPTEGMRFVGLKSMYDPPKGKVSEVLRPGASRRASRW
jgi:sodium/potassium-transporting ATPase subunit alpha